MVALVGDIAYPIFCMAKKPYEIIYSIDTISIRKTPTSHLETVDNKTLSGDFFARLLQLEHRVDFEYTCKDMQDIVYCGARWGIDCKAIPHEIPSMHLYETDVRRVERISNNLLWVRKISYPFRIPTREKISIHEDLYAKIIKIGNEWFIRDFSYKENGFSNTL